MKPTGKKLQIRVRSRAELYKDIKALIKEAAELELDETLRYLYPAACAAVCGDEPGFSFFVSHSISGAQSQWLTVPLKTFLSDMEESFDKSNLIDPVERKGAERFVRQLRKSVEVMEQKLKEGAA